MNETGVNIHVKLEQTNYLNLQLLKLIMYTNIYISILFKIYLYLKL